MSCALCNFDRVHSLKEMSRRHLHEAYNAARSMHVMAVNEGVRVWRGMREIGEKSCAQA